MYAASFVLAIISFIIIKTQVILNGHKKVEVRKDVELSNNDQYNLNNMKYNKFNQLGKFY